MPTSFDLSNGAGAYDVPMGLDKITGKYVGKFEDANVYESKKLTDDEGITLPGRGIIVGKGVYTKKENIHLLMHEYGHILQAKQDGKFVFYKNIGTPSLLSAAKHGKNDWDHNKYWTEVFANILAKNHFQGVAWKHNYNPTSGAVFDYWFVLYIKAKHGL